MTTSVLHIAPHYGGGVGTVLRSLIEQQIDRDIQHQLLAFESINDVMTGWAEAHNIPYLAWALLNEINLKQWIVKADIVHVHWWNHPLLIQWMTLNMPASRCVFWSHVNGIHAPQIFFNGLFLYPDWFVFASAYSFQSTQIPTDQQQISVIQSQSKIKIAQAEKLHSRTFFNVGYIGTVDPSKMHPDFIQLCVDAQLEQARFIVCGGPQHSALQQAACKRGFEALFDIRGVVDNVDGVLAELDVFGYPLSAVHYGTGEQVLLEAMGAGVPAVVLDSGCERYIIDEGENGIICGTTADYSTALRYLSQHPDVLARLSSNALKKAKQLMQQQQTDAWGAFYQQMLQHDKRQHCLTLSTTLHDFPEGARLLFQSYGLSDITKNLQRLAATSTEENDFNFPWGIFSATRGSPYHYLKFFPADPVLQKICQRLDRYKTTELLL